MSLADDIRLYQIQLEVLRRMPDDEQLREDLDKARAAMEVSWLESKAVEPCA